MIEHESSEELTVTEMLLLMTSYIPAVLCIVLAGLLVMRGIGGWGWFLFVAILVVPGRIRTGKAVWGNKNG